MHITILWTSRDVLTEKFAENFWVQQYWKAIEKFVKSECEEGYSNDLTEFVFGAHFFRRSMEDDNEEVEQFTMGNISAIDLADEALGNLDNSDIFCTGKVRLQMAQEKAKLNGQPVVKHRNGKGQAHHMFSRFLILRFFYEISFVLFF